MARVTKTPEDRKQEIIETALELFSKKGYENTTIQDIADSMHVATGLCYRYFKSKQEIFATASQYYAQQAVKKLQLSSLEKQSPLEKFSFMLTALFEYAINHNEFESSYHDEPQISAQRLDELSKQIALEMIPVIEQGVLEGVFQCNDIPNTVNFLAAGIIHMIHMNMPLADSKEYIISFVPLVKELCINVLQIQEIDGFTIE